MATLMRAKRFNLKNLKRTLGVFFSFSLCLIATQEAMGQTESSKAIAIKRAKELSADIDRYVESHPDSSLMIIGRYSRDAWEWKTITTSEEGESFIEGFWVFQQVWVWLKDERLIFIRIAQWSESGDWYFYPDYYFDEQGRILQIASDFRTAIDRLKVKAVEYFDDKGQTLDKVVEYYAVGFPSDSRLVGKPEKVKSFILDPERYLKISDLPFWPVISSHIKKNQANGG